MVYTFRDITKRTMDDLIPVEPEKYSSVIGERYARNIAGILVSEDEKNECLDRLAAKITADYTSMQTGNIPLVVAPLLNGAMYLAVELTMRLGIPHELDTLKIESYGGGTKSGGEIRIHKDFSRSVKGKHVLLVEDVVDSGRTMDFMHKFLKHKGPASVKTVTFLDKPAPREVYVRLDYAGFRIPDMFVVGYGLDYNHELRNLPVIAVYSEKKK